MSTEDVECANSLICGIKKIIISYIQIPFFHLLVVSRTIRMILGLHWATASQHSPRIIIMSSFNATLRLVECSVTLFRFKITQVNVKDSNFKKFRNRVTNRYFCINLLNSTQIESVLLLSWRNDCS